MSMFCYQCQEAAKGIGCTGLKGVCGIESEVINLQDLNVWLLKGVAHYAVKAREKGVENANVNRFINKVLFSTITNVNFDKNAFLKQVRETLILREEIREKQLATQKNQAKKIEETEKLIEKFRAKASKASMAQSLIKKLDKVERIEVDEDDNSVMNISFPVFEL